MLTTNCFVLMSERAFSVQGVANWPSINCFGNNGGYLLKSTLSGCLSEQTLLNPLRLWTFLLSIYLRHNIVATWKLLSPARPMVLWLANTRSYFKGGDLNLSVFNLKCPLRHHEIRFKKIGLSGCWHHYNQILTVSTAS